MPLLKSPLSRRTMLKAGMAGLAAGFLPMPARANEQSQVIFDNALYEQNSAQVIMIFMYGGPSALSGNMTNIEEIYQHSQSRYQDYFQGLTVTENGFWQEAGGASMERLLASGDLSVYRTCYSQIREDENNRAHGLCTEQNQKGVNNLYDQAGVFANIANTLIEQGKVDGQSVLPFVSLQGDNHFFYNPEAMDATAKAVSISGTLSNPFERRYANHWFYYTSDERSVEGYTSQRAQLDIDMDALASRQAGQHEAIRYNFQKRSELDGFINGIKDSELPVGIEYQNNNFARDLKSAINILSANSDTKMVTLSGATLGNWDDHSEARDYTSRMENVWAALETGMAHLKALNKEQDVSIMVFGEFGRNVNLNSSLGWDHGNLQNFFTLGGSRYLNSVGVQGETKVIPTGQVNRLYLYPDDNSDWFEPYSIAASLYRFYGITNPEVLTQGHDVISGLHKT